MTKGFKGFKQSKATLDSQILETYYWWKLQYNHMHIQAQFQKQNNTRIYTEWDELNKLGNHFWFGT